MQDVPLNIGRLLVHGSTVHHTSTIDTWTGTQSRRQTHGETGRRCGALANALVELGVNPGDSVATMMWNCSEHIEAYLAIPSMGCVIHAVNIRLPISAMAATVNKAMDRTILVGPTLLPVLEQLLPLCPEVTAVIIIGDHQPTFSVPDSVRVLWLEELLDGQSTYFQWPELDERTAAAVSFTSGTTGSPKGVVYTHRSIWLHTMQMCMAEAAGIDWNDSILVTLPMFHALSWGLPFAAFMTGASLVLPDHFNDAQSLVDILASERPSKAATVPSIWQAVLRHVQHHPQDLSHLGEVLVGGTTVPPALMRAYEDRHDIRIIQAWGMTETSPLGTISRPPNARDSQDPWAFRTSQGRFPAAVQARVVDLAGEVLANDGNSIGEIEVRGPWVANSYLGEEGNADYDSIRMHDGWLRTGDVGSIDEFGYLRVSDRIQDVILSGGEWISSTMLENEVMSNPEVDEAACVGFPDDRWGLRPLILAKLASNSESSAQDLADHLASRVDAWMRPRHWAIVDDIPRTSVNKFDKLTIRLLLQQDKLDIVEVTA